ncbi:hypothetical protein [Streptomyces sp. NPDC003032]
MHGHGHAPQQPPPPSGGTHVTLRVLFVVLAVVTCGLLAWTTLLRLAIVTRKAYDWALFGVATALDVTALVLIGMDPGEDEFQGPGNAGMIILLCTLMAAVAYYLFAEIRHFSRYRPAAPGFPAPGPAHSYGHGPQQTQPVYGYPHQQPPAPAPQQPAPAPAPPQPTAPTAPQPTAPARIHQVRAELDELSDYLRKQQGGS